MLIFIVLIYVAMAITPDRPITKDTEPMQGEVYRGL